MNPERSESLDARAQSAVEELQSLIQEHYPAATFAVERGPDDPEAVHLVTTIDLEDTDEILEVVAERVMELQIDEGVPVFVIPLRPAARVSAMLEAVQAQPAPDLPMVYPHP